MTQLVWNGVGSRIFEAGVDHGVLYLDSDRGVAWNGLISVDESPTGGDITPYYIDGFKYLNYSSPEEFSGTIQAYTYPDEFEQCDGSLALGSGLFLFQQKRSSFNLSYRTLLGNDLRSIQYGYKIHLVYNATVVPTKRTYSSLSESLDPTTFSWVFQTRPDLISGLYYPTAHVAIDSTKTNADILEWIESQLYGNSSEESRLIPLSELIGFFVDNPQALEIYPDSESGIAELIPSEDPDLIGSIDKGIYFSSNETRLQEADDEGTYTLD